MKVYLSDILSGTPNPLLRRNLMREYLQARILESLQRSGAMIPLAFHGGTALRFLYRIPRYSEDLDFSLEYPDRGYDLRKFLYAIQSDLSREGYHLSLKINDRKTIQAALIRFGGLLSEMGVSPHPNEVLSVKIEVDTCPPAGTGLVTTLVRRHVTLQLQHHDHATLLAGKLHAILQRKYAKGRDLYDLFWYLSDPNWGEPNIPYLVNALKQSGWNGELPAPSTWRHIIDRRLAKLEWKTVQEDVLPFLERVDEAANLTYANLHRLLFPP